MMDLVLSITESVSQVSLYLSSDAIFVHRGKGGEGGGPHNIQQHLFMTSWMA